MVHNRSQFANFWRRYCQLSLYLLSLRDSVSPTPRIRRAQRTYALRLAQSGKINFNKNLACGVACMRLLGGFYGWIPTTLAPPTLPYSLHPFMQIRCGVAYPQHAPNVPATLG
jgi:hypothetical protein